MDTAISRPAATGRDSALTDNCGRTGAPSNETLSFDPDSNKSTARITLLLRESEALELIEKLTYLVAHPEFHHDHLEDYANSCVLDTVVLDHIDPLTLTDDIQSQLKELK